jgi:hypothetical protein
LAITRPRSDEFWKLLMAAAGMPICANCAAWSCISAISGETITAVFPETTAGSW